MLTCKIAQVSPPPPEGRQNRDRKFPRWFVRFHLSSDWLGALFILMTQNLRGAKQVDDQLHAH